MDMLTIDPNMLTRRHYQASPCRCAALQWVEADLAWTEFGGAIVREANLGSAYPGGADLRYPPSCAMLSTMRVVGNSFAQFDRRHLDLPASPCQQSGNAFLKRFRGWEQLNTVVPFR
jgi:hypothetical protein